MRIELLEQGEGELTSKNVSDELSEIRSRRERDVHLSLADDDDLVVGVDAVT